MVTISLCMIVKNEEDCLIRCLDSIFDAVDEIIIVDTGSDDRTVELAKRYTDKIYHFEWIDNFSAARNYAFSKASMDYCMWLDADDVLLENDLRQLKDLKASLSPETDIVMMRYNTAFDEFGNPLFVYYRERIIKNNGLYLWQGRIHEVITPQGKIIHSDIAVTHKKDKASEPGRNLRIFERMIKEGESLSPRDMFYYARELYYHKNYKKAILVFCDFLTSPGAWKENKIDACRILADCYVETDNLPAAVSVLAQSFSFDPPRAEICCKLGDLMMQNKNYHEAIHWYELALSIKPCPENGGFILPDCYGFLPSIWLCVCYDRIGEFEKAFMYNNRAMEYKPNSNAVASNRIYFENKGLYKN